MKFELLLAISILIVIAIISLFISIWTVFITKKRTTILSATDFFYGLIIGILAGTTANVYVMLVVMQVIALWFVIIGVKTKENQRERDQREMEQRNMLRYKKES